MPTITMLSQKGGTGKTTLSLHLAVAAEQTGRTAVVIDLDPQASAAAWGDQRGRSPAVVAVPHGRLAQALDIARSHGADLVIIDTAPNSDQAALVASKAADLVIIPCRPAILDLRAIAASVELARYAQKPAAVVLNGVPTRGPVSDDAELALEVHGLPISPVRVAYRAAYSRSLTTGHVAQEYEPEGKAAEEVGKLYRWTCRQVGMKAGRHEQRQEG
jgi:chromosome partitioning protein